MGRKLNSSLCHRDKERIRHQMLNKSLDHLCSVVPGLKQKETKAFKLKRIMSYVKFLHRKKNLITSSLLSVKKKDDLKSDVNNYSQVTQCLKNIEMKSSKACKAEIVFLRKGSQMPCYPSDKELTSKPLSSHMKTQIKNNQMMPSHKELSNNEELEHSIFSRSNENISFKESEFFENIKNLQSEDGHVIYSDCGIGCNLSVSSIDLNSNKKENVRPDYTAIVKQSVKRHGSVDQGFKKSIKNSSQFKTKEKSPVLTNNKLSKCEELNSSLSLNDTFLEEIDLMQIEGEEVIKKNSFKNSCTTYKANTSEIYDKNTISPKNIANKISTSTSKTKIISDHPITETSANYVSQSDIDDQIVPNFVNVLVNFQNKNKVKDIYNHTRDKSVKIVERDTATDVNDVSSTINDSPFTSMKSQPKSHIPSDVFPAPTEENASVLTDLSNRKKVTNAHDHLLQIEKEVAAPIAKYGDDSYTLNNSNNNLFYNNYIFPHYREDAFIPNYPLTPINPWSSQFGAYVSHAYTENMLYKNVGPFNYMNISPMVNNAQVYESELCGPNILLSQARENNYSDVMQDLVDASNRSQNEVPRNASCFPILNDIEIKNEFVAPEPLSIETSYCASKSSPLHSYLISDKSGEFVNLNNPALITDDVVRPSFDENADLSAMLTKEKRSKRQRKQSQTSITPKKSTTFQDNITKKLKNMSGNDAKDQVVPGEICNLGAISTSSKVKGKSQNKSKRRSLKNVDHLRSGFMHFRDMEKCYLSFDEKTSIEGHGSKKYKYSSFNGEASSFNVSEKKRLSNKDNEYRWMYDPPIVIKQEIP